MKRQELLFALMCIPARILLAIEGRNAPMWLTVLASIISVGFAYIWITGARKTGIETGGLPIWWNTIRPVHALLWALFAITAFQGREWAWKFLAMDVIIGLTAFFFYK